MQNRRPTDPGGAERRLPVLSRASEDALPPFRMRSRDFEIVRAVAAMRCLTTLQIEALFFAPPRAKRRGTLPLGSNRKINTRCQRRLQQLFHRGYLYRDELPQRLSEGRRPLVYFLDHAGARLLAEQGEDFDWQPEMNDVGHPFIEHTLATNEIRVAMTIGAAAHGYVLTNWIDDSSLKSRHTKDYVTVKGPQGGSLKVAIVPDGYCCMDIGTHVAHFFIEADRGTVVGQSERWGRRDFSRKVRAFNTYIDAGKFEERYGGRGMRILVVTTGKTRLENLKRVIESAGGRRRYWLTTFDALRPDSVLTKRIWRVATSDKNHRLIESQ